jgi:putative DNA primase/helicase
MQKASKAKADGEERAIKKRAADNPMLSTKALEEQFQRAAQEAGDPGKPPTCKRYTTNEVNPASLCKLLRENPNGVLIYRDELASLLESFRREDLSELRGLLLSGWTGTGQHTLDRIGGDGLGQFIPHVCLSLLGTTQPGRIAPYVRDAVEETKGDDGLLQRFQFAVWPDDAAAFEEVDLPLNLELEERAFQVYERLSEPWWFGSTQDTNADGTPFGLPYLQLSAEARKRWVAWRMENWRASRSEDLSAAMQSHLGKYPKLVSSIALICHLADGHSGEIGLGSLERAIRWATYLASHASRIYGSGPVATVTAARAILAKLGKQDLQSGFTARDIQRKKWSALASPGTVRNALDLLCEHAWLEEHEKKTGGRPTASYTLNPKARLGAAGSSGSALY